MFFKVTFPFKNGGVKYKVVTLPNQAVATGLAIIICHLALFCVWCIIFIWFKLKPGTWQLRGWQQFLPWLAMFCPLVFVYQLSMYPGVNFAAIFINALLLFGAAKMFLY
jgi:hypothetical protein